MHRRNPGRSGFNLIELTVVILLIMILMGFVFTAGQGMFDRARKTQAKNDVTQIATAVNAFYTEYGQYPIPSASQGSDYQILANDNSVVINALRASAADTLNTRKIVFLSPPQASGTPCAKRSRSGQRYLLRSMVGRLPG